MDLLNATKMIAGYSMGMEPSGREHLVVVAKGTFELPAHNGVPDLAQAQAPLVMADIHAGEPGYSSVQHEIDFALRKSKCDVLLNGTAYAPRGEPAIRVLVRLRIGPVDKSFFVVGNRHWSWTDVGAVASNPESFTTMPITYGRAFGGTDGLSQDPNANRAYMPNPVGCGSHSPLHRKLLDGQPLPNTEAHGENVTHPDGNYRPMSFGVVGRHFSTRSCYGGTYDQDWIDNTFPFLPADFDDRYYQAAAEDQQIPHPRGGEAVELANLTPEGRYRFHLPSIDVPVTFFPADGEPVHKKGVLDTIIIEPDFGRLMLVWRQSIPLRKNMFEIEQVVVGQMSRAWWRARELGKEYYPGLGRLVRAKRGFYEDND